MKFSLVLAFAGASSTLAAPILPFLDTIGDAVDDAIGGSGNEAAPTPVPANEIPNFARIAQFARASYCSPPVVQDWACGEACDANPQTQPIIAGGDGEEIPRFFVAFDPPSNSIVVAHEGTNTSSIDSLSNDVDLFFSDPSDEAFPGAKDAGAQLHSGFQDTFERTSQEILESVNAGIAKFNATNVIITGHSLGAAMGLLDTMFLASQLGPSINIRAIGFGLPRVGNKEWADFVDKTAQDRNIDFEFVVNNDDPVPRLPPVALGFQHPSGEIFQKNNDGSIETLQCPGQENENCLGLSSLLEANIGDHDGPYAGVELGSASCTL